MFLIRWYNMLKPAVLFCVQPKEVRPFNPLHLVASTPPYYQISAFLVPFVYSIVGAIILFTPEWYCDTPYGYPYQNPKNNNYVAPHYNNLASM
jgi:hypothetical protein